MACYDTYPYTCTYDSGGAGSLPGGGDPDYSTVATWEVASDNDLSGTGITILDCYDSQAHDDGGVVIAGATNVDNAHYRMIQSSDSCSTPYIGKKNTGANFEYNTVTGTIFGVTEDWVRFQDLVTKLTLNTSSSTKYYNFNLGISNHVKVINCVIHDSSNSGGGTDPSGIYFSGDQQLAYNCIVYDNTGYGFYLYAVATRDTMAAICCTAVNNGQYGFWADKLFGDDEAIVWSCYGADNSSGDFLDTSIEWNAASGWNSSKDNTSDLGGAAGNNYKNSNDLITSGKLDSDYLPTEHIYWSGGAGDNAGRNPYDDLSASYDFDDFFRNDTNGETISKYDIQGVARPDADVIDSSWDIGAATLAILTLTPDESVIELVSDSPLLLGILTPDESVIELVSDQPTLLGTLLTPNESVIELVSDSPGFFDILTPDESVIELVSDQPTFELICVPNKSIIYLVSDSPAIGNLIIDWSIASTAEKTLNQAYVYIIAFQGARNGQRCRLALKQDAIGGRTVGFPNNVRAGVDITLPLSLSAGANLTDYVDFIYREDIDIYDIVLLRRGY